LDAYLDDLERACRLKNVQFRFGEDIETLADLPASYDRIVIATGARYKLRLTRPIVRFLRLGFGKSALVRRLFRSARLRDWFYYRARRSVLPHLGKLHDHHVTVIGDAASPGKTREAVESAFKAALVTAHV